VSAPAIFRSRLETLAALLETAERQWSGDLAALVAARLAPDMHPFAWQIVFTCNQPHEYLAWCAGGTYTQPDPAAMDWTALKAHVAETLAALSAVDKAPPAEKRIELPPADAHLVLTGPRYADDWLMPNFYFHLVTSYALLRMKGIALGKVDYMAHLVGEIRPNG